MRTGSLGQAMGALAFAAVLTGTGAAQSSMSDAQVEANVLRAMAGDARLANQPVSTSTAFGTVTLTGAVPDEATRVAAEQVASHTAGVKKVVDQLSIGQLAVTSASGASPAGPAGTNAQDEDPAARNVLADDSQIDGRAGTVNGNQGAATPSPSGYPQDGNGTYGNGPVNPQPPVYSQGSQQGYPQQQAQYPQAQYPQAQYPQTPYPPDQGQGQAQQGRYPQAQYPQAQYPQGGYPQNGSPQAQVPYPQTQYPQTESPQAQNQSPQDGYGQPQGRIYRREWEQQQGYGRNGVTQAPYAQQPYYSQAPQSGQIGGQRVLIASGAVLPIRITRWISSGDAQPGSTFTGVVENDILAGGWIAIPRGAEVQGAVVDAKGAGVLKGRGSLTLQLTELRLGGQQIPIQSEAFTVNGHDKTVQSVNATLGVAALGAIIGGVAGGGTGAAIGAGVGGAAGLGASAASGGGNATIPAEALLRFRLVSPVQVATLSEAEMQRLGAYAGPQGAQRPLPPPGYYPTPYPYAPNPYYYGRSYRYGY